MVPDAKGDRISILVQRGSSPFSEIESDAWDIVIRPAFLPVNLSVQQHFERVRQPISTDSFGQARASPHYAAAYDLPKVRVSATAGRGGVQHTPT